MTTRNQKRSNEITPTNANVSENGAVLDMLLSTNANGNKTRIEETTQTDPAIAKDVLSVRNESSASSKEHDNQNSKSTDPASAKDHGKLLCKLYNDQK